MTDDPKTVPCREFQDQLADLVGSGELENHPHYQSCELCRALVADLKTIAQAVRDLMPVEDPPDELWDQIEAAINREDHLSQK